LKVVIAVPLVYSGYATAVGGEYIGV